MNRLEKVIPLLCNSMEGPTDHVDDRHLSLIMSTHHNCASAIGVVNIVDFNVIGAK